MFQQPPHSLDADPATTGLVVLDFYLGTERGLPYIVHGAHIQGTAAGSPDIYAARLEVSNESMGVMFQDVPPGRYRVTRLLGFYFNTGNKPTVLGWSVADTSLGFDVVAGGLSYVGHFTATTRGRKVSIAWYHTPMRERTVWRAVARKYPHSRWDAAIAQRVAAIEPLISESPSADRSSAIADSASGARALENPLSQAGDSTRHEVFDGIVMAEKLGSFSRRAGPVGFGSRLIVSRDRLEYPGKKSTLIIMATQLRSVSRNDKWVIVDYDYDGAPKRLFFGFGLYTDSETTDRIELSLTALLRRRGE